MVATTPASAFTDVAHLHLVMVPRLELMQARLGGGWAARRFRPNVLLLGVGATEEDLPGRELRTGNALLHVTQGAVRCVMLTRPLAGLPEATGILRTLASESGARFGLYAQILTPAPIQTGATVEVLEAGVGDAPQESGQ